MQVDMEFTALQLPLGRKYVPEGYLQVWEGARHLLHPPYLCPPLQPPSNPPDMRAHTRLSSH